ncbi:MAG: tetratricopeptide repeat protein [Bacteroidota bacterium]
MKNHAWGEVEQSLPDSLLKEQADWRLFWNRGWSRFQRDRKEEALGDMLGALPHTQTGKERATCLTFAGIVGLALGRYEASVNYFMQSLSLEDRAMTRKHLALAYQEQGQTEAAERIHQVGLKKFPQDRERLAAYGDFLLDQGRVEEAHAIMGQLNQDAASGSSER